MTSALAPEAVTSLELIIAQARAIISASGLIDLLSLTRTN